MSSNGLGQQHSHRSLVRPPSSVGISCGPSKCLMHATMLVEASMSCLPPGVAAFSASRSWCAIAGSGRPPLVSTRSTSYLWRNAGGGGLGSRARSPANVPKTLRERFARVIRDAADRTRCAAANIDRPSGRQRNSKSTLMLIVSS